MAIFKTFFTDEILGRLYDEFDHDDLVLSTRTHRDKNGNVTSVKGKKMRLCKKYIWQALAVYVRIVGYQGKNKNKKESIDACIKHFGNGKCVGREIIERLITSMLLTEKYSALISSNFYGFVLTLGQFVAGDEKLWFFSGNGGNVRLCISKPDRIGLWFYELCAPLRNGLPYLLQFQMHNSSVDSVTVVSIVKGWIEVIFNVGVAPPGVNPNPKTFLAMDSYYMAADSRALCNNAGIKFTCSIKTDRFKNETYMLHPPGFTDKPLPYILLAFTRLCSFITYDREDSLEGMEGLFSRVALLSILLLLRLSDAPVTVTVTVTRSCH